MVRCWTWFRDLRVLRLVSIVVSLVGGVWGLSLKRTTCSIVVEDIRMVVEGVWRGLGCEKAEGSGWVVNESLEVRWEIVNSSKGGPLKTELEIEWLTIEYLDLNNKI